MYVAVLENGNICLLSVIILSVLKTYILKKQGVLNA